MCDVANKTYISAEFPTTVVIGNMQHLTQQLSYGFNYREAERQGSGGHLHSQQVGVPGAGVETHTPGADHSETKPTELFSFCKSASGPLATLAFVFLKVFLSLDSNTAPVVIAARPRYTCWSAQFLLHDLKFEVHAVT